MGDSQGFLKYSRGDKRKQAVEERVHHFDEFVDAWEDPQYTKEAARCMDCGVPFCHNGCPLGNKIPDFNDAVYRGEWKEAFHILKSTNNFPEFTGRICPAPCEASCVLALHSDAVNIEHIEKEIAQRAFLEGWEKPIKSVDPTGKKVAVVGSGPAGLAAAEELFKKGHSVTVFERDEAAGGLLRFGIPDFKLNKEVVARRVSLMEKAGIHFRCGVEIGKDMASEDLEASFDAIVLCTGSSVPRALPIPGKELEGIHFAMDYLTHQNRLISGVQAKAENRYHAGGKQVVVLGGGDTGADCVGTANRQKAAEVTQIELMERPPEQRSTNNPWPEWPMTLTHSSSHEEGVERDWALLTKAFIGEGGKLTGIKTVRIEWKNTSTFEFAEIPNTEKIIPCDMALLAIGFIHPEHKGPVNQWNLALDDHGNIKTTGFQTSNPKVFAAGDCRRGQSLVVWAIQEGRQVAKAVEKHLEPVCVG